MDDFHPVVRAWFAARVGTPTEIQAAAWPRIAAGDHVLAIAPTGSGKTLTAFLWALDRLLSGAWEPGATRVLYISPLKALNNDIQRNLLRPLAELHEAFHRAGSAPPAVRAQVRSGDTPPDERQRMARRPPEILITTPESVNVLLTSVRGRALFASLRTVIVDEVHAVVGTKRGAQLATSLERLVALAGEFQRLALSATVRPAETVARWVGGHERRGDLYRPRDVRIVASSAPKAYDLRVTWPAAGPVPPPRPGEDDTTGAWPAVAAEVRRRVHANRSTLVFTNSRRSVEKLTRLVNENEPREIVWAHHGSLSREVRRGVEERLKNGELSGIVATNSLELGIDIGALDEVVLVQAPPTLAATAQRIGRAGHAVGATSRARFVPLVERDLLESAVAARAVLDGAIEPVEPVRGALDVLAQAIVSMTANETWTVDALYDTLRASDPYHGLSRRAFELVLEMLAGRYASARVPGLAAMVSVDRLRDVVRGLPGAARRVYLGGGTIPDRGYFHLKRSDSGALIGELDEEFVWERAVGDAFTLGVQTWRIEQITHNDVLVTPAAARQALAPFWRADARDRGFELAARIGTFLEAVAPRLDDRALPRDLGRDHLLDPDAAEALIDYLRRQQDATGAIPHRHRLVVERTSDPGEDTGSGWLVLHTLWGGRVNRPLALAIAAAWDERYGVPLETAHDDGVVVLAAEGGLDARAVLDLVRPERLEDLLRRGLARTGFFGARFREAASTALLLPRAGFNRRTPLWMSRQRAKVLLDAVRRHDDFPLVLEAWRSCLADAFDLEALRKLLGELHDGTIALHEAQTSTPSPFAGNVVWKRTNELMYEDDTPPGAAGVRPDLLREAVFDRAVRPRVPVAVADTFRRKLQRLEPGYAPRTADELFDWIVERRLVPAPEWDELLAAMRRDHGVDPAASGAELAGRVAAVALAHAAPASFVAAVQEIPAILRALGRDPDGIDLRSPLAPAVADPRAAAALVELLARGAPDLPDGVEPLEALVADILRAHGIVSAGFVGAVLGIDAATEAAVLEALADAHAVVIDRLTSAAADDRDETVEIADAENLERMLRIARARARPSFAPRPVSELPAFLALWHDLGAPGDGPEDVGRALEKLFGWDAPAALWETDLLPARVAAYRPAWLDALMAESDLAWLGTGDGRATFGPPEDRVLWTEPAATIDAADEDLAGKLFPTPGARFRFEDLLLRTGMGSIALSAALWRLAWRGIVTSDGYGALRRGIETGFKPAEQPAEAAHAAGARRLRFERWKTTRPFGGAWHRLEPVEPATDPVDRDALDRDRARLLVARYGIVFRELAARELPLFHWSRLFRALRLMELGGEVLAGQFFDGVGGLQFISHAAFRRLSEGVDDARTWWVSALDPVAPAGLGLATLAESSIRRTGSTRLVYEGTRLAALFERGARRLDLRVAPDDARVVSVLAPLADLLTRAVHPQRSLSVETINGAPAAASPYLAALSELVHVDRDVERVVLSRRY